MLKTYLLTGHRGYIGSGLNDWFSTLGGGAITCDWKDGSDYSSIQGTTIDVVIHLAASVSVIESMLDPALYFENNCFGVRDLLRNNKIGRFVFASTGGAMYGNKLRARESDASLTNCLSPYAQSKFLAEQVVRNCCENHCILRLANVVGGDPAIRGEAAAEQHFMTDDPIVVYGGTQTRDLVNIKWVHEAIKRAALGMMIGTFNIGSGFDTRILSCARSFGDERKVPVKIVPARPGEVEFISLDISLAKAAGLLD